jgi:hypothetical protein
MLGLDAFVLMLSRFKVATILLADFTALYPFLLLSKYNKQWLRSRLLTDRLAHSKNRYLIPNKDLS